MKEVSKNDRLRQFGRTTTLALVAGAPMIGTIATAEAAPPSHAPAWGYRSEQVQYQDRIRQDVSVTGVVTSDLPGDQFDVRADNGRIYRVVFHRRDSEPRRISRGDRVVVEGNLDRDILIARDVRILDNRGTGGGGGQTDHRNFTTTGVVTSDLPGDQFDIRSDDGRTYRVVFHRRDSEPRRLSRGDRVSVDGHLDRDILIAHDVRILDNRGTGGGGQYDRNFSTTGVVTSDLTGDQFDVRADNGRIYRVVFPRRVNEPRRLSRGDRVIVEGNLDRDIIVARDVRILDNGGNNNLITREGVVTEDLSGDQFRMRLDNGRTVLVRGRNDEPRRLSRGDRVLVTGRFSDTREDTFIARTVRILENRGNGNRPWIERRTLTGVVERDRSGDAFDLRVDGAGGISNGRVVRVQVRRDEPNRLSRGDTVTVTGRFSRTNDLFIAESVRILENRGSGDWNQRRTLSGVVTRDYSGDNFEMRVDSLGNSNYGRNVRVDVRGNEPNRLSRGDTVTVTGRFTSNDRSRFTAESVRVTRNR